MVYNCVAVNWLNKSCIFFSNRHFKQSLLCPLHDDNPDLAQVGTESLVSWVEVTQAGVEAVAGEETQFGCRAAGGYPVPDIEVPISNYLTIYISTL